MGPLLCTLSDYSHTSQALILTCSLRLCCLWEGLGPHHSWAFGVGVGVFMSSVLKEGRASREQVDLRPYGSLRGRGMEQGERREKGLESPGAMLTSESSGDQLRPPVFSGWGGGGCDLGPQSRGQRSRGLLPWLSGKASVYNAGDVARAAGSIPGSRRFPWRRKWQPTPVFLPGKSRG